MDTQMECHANTEADTLDRTLPGGRPVRFFTAEQILLAFSLLAVFLLLHFFYQPRLGVRDADDLAYVIGARSIRAGNGYHGLAGSELIHWPFGYSLLLSLFPDPFKAALWVNHISLVIASGALYIALRRCAWGWQAAFGLCSVMAFGFFRILAGSTRPDVLTYAFFLIGFVAYQSGRWRRHLWAYAWWALLIPLKLVAAVFVPAAVASEWVGSRFRVSRLLLRKWLCGLVMTGVFVSLVFTVNYLAMQRFVSPSHERFELVDAPRAAWSLLYSLVRSFLWNWYGTIESWPLLTVSAATLVLALVCLASLRPNAVSAMRGGLLGPLILAFSLSLFLVREFGTNTRLLGYGLLAAVCMFTPIRRARHLWCVYGVIAIALGIVNMSTANALGANDPRYEAVAKEVASRFTLDAPVGSNSFHILDLHANLPTMPVRNTPSFNSLLTFVWIQLPQYDSVATIVWPIEVQRRGWCVTGVVPGATVFHRCD